MKKIKFILVLLLCIVFIVGVYLLTNYFQHKNDCCSCCAEGEICIALCCRCKGAIFKYK